MLASLVLAAALMGQLPDNAGNLWTGNGYVLATFDTTKPLKFQGGSISCDLKWNPAMDGFGGGFESDPLDLGVGQMVRLQVYARFGGDKQTWGLCEVGQGPPVLSTVGDFMIEFDAASAGPVNISGTTTTRTVPRLWALNRAGCTSYTITQ